MGHPLDISVCSEIFRFDDRRSYVRVEIEPKQLTADLRAMESVRTADAACSTLASFFVEDGRPGPQSV